MTGEPYHLRGYLLLHVVVFGVPHFRNICGEALCVFGMDEEDLPTYLLRAYIGRSVGDWLSIIYTLAHTMGSLESQLNQEYFVTFAKFGIRTYVYAFSSNAIKL